MSHPLEELRDAALQEIGAAKDEHALDAVRIRYLGRSGSISGWSEQMKSLGKDERPIVGKLLNEARTAVMAAIEESATRLRDAHEAAALANIDISLPGSARELGSLHPLTQILDRAIQIFRRMGFALADGPDIETEWHCFDALNTAPDHPARNEQDTFYLPDGRLLRTHTLYVDQDVSVADLKGTLEFFFHELVGAQTAVRFRPHYFPFTEPSFEIDVKSKALKGGEQWIEVAGSGMVHPAVFEEVDSARGDTAYDPEKWTGFAFGLGMDRLAMILFDIPDIRFFVQNDLRFLRQFA